MFMENVLIKIYTSYMKIIKFLSENSSMVEPWSPKPVMIVQINLFLPYMLV